MTPAASALARLEGAGAPDASPARAPAAESAPTMSKAPLSPAPESPRLRDMIARRLADLLFLPSGQLSPAEKALLESLLVPLYDGLEPQERERLARRIAELRELPHELARRLARDRPEIATLVLERADALDEQDLVALIKSGSHAHQLAIAARPLLSASAAEELVAGGRRDVIETLLRNESAKISRRAFRYLVELSRRDARLPAFLLAREDLPFEVAHDLFWLVESPLRFEIVMRFGLERRLIAQALSDLPAGGAALDDPPVRAALSVLGLMRLPAVPQETLADTLSAWLRAQGQAGVPLLRWTGLSKETLERIRRDPWGEPQAVLFKALGAPREALARLGEALQPRWPESERTLRLKHLARLFDSMARDWAELLLRLWDRRPQAPLEAFIEETRVNGSSSAAHPSSARGAGLSGT